MIYREATIWDALFITKLWVLMRNEIAIITEQRSGGSDETESFYIKLIVKIKQKNFFVLVAEEDKKIVGFIISEANYAQYGSKMTGFCNAIYVDKEHRNTGIANQLINRSMARGKELGIVESEFITVYDPKTINAWERKGFKPVQVVYRKEV